MAKSRWTGLALGFAGLLLFSAECTAAPALIVEIKCKPGTADLWQAEFDKEILPAINESIAKGDGFTRFFHIEAALPFQQFDFVLVYEFKSFAGLDIKRPFPHYLALYHKSNPTKGQQAKFHSRK